MVHARKKRQQYTDAQRTKVLAAAQSEKLTAKQIEKRFGVTPVTYYSWRKKAKLPAAPRGRRPANATRNGLAARATHGLRETVRRRVDEIVRDEMRKALADLR